MSELIRNLVNDLNKNYPKKKFEFVGLAPNNAYIAFHRNLYPSQYRMGPLWVIRCLNSSLPTNSKKVVHFQRVEREWLVNELMLIEQYDDFFNQIVSDAHGYIRSTDRVCY